MKFVGVIIYLLIQEVQEARGNVYCLEKQGGVFKHSPDEKQWQKFCAGEVQTAHNCIISSSTLRTWAWQLTQILVMLFWWAWFLTVRLMRRRRWWQINLSELTATGGWPNSFGCPWTGVCKLRLVMEETVSLVQNRNFHEKWGHREVSQRQCRLLPSPLFSLTGLFAGPPADP